MQTTSKLLAASGRVLVIALLGCAVLAASPMPVKNPPSAALEQSCCARMMKDPGHCLPQPGGMTGPGCTTAPSALQLFLQTNTFQFDPGCREFVWESFVSKLSQRPHRPPVPPPRA